MGYTGKAKGFLMRVLEAEREDECCTCIVKGLSYRFDDGKFFFINGHAFQLQPEFLSMLISKKRMHVFCNFGI